MANIVDFENLCDVSHSLLNLKNNNNISTSDVVTKYPYNVKFTHDEKILFHTLIVEYHLDKSIRLTQPISAYIHQHIKLKLEVRNMRTWFSKLWALKKQIKVFLDNKLKKESKEIRILRHVCDSKNKNTNITIEFTELLKDIYSLIGSHGRITRLKPLQLQ